MSLQEERTDTDMGKRPCEDGGRGWSDAAVSQGTPSIVSATGSWRRKGRTARALRGSVALLAPRFQTSSVQNWERMHFCCFGPPSLWYFVLTAPVTSSTHFPPASQMAKPHPKPAAKAAGRQCAGVLGPAAQSWEEGRVPEQAGTELELPGRARQYQMTWPRPESVGLKEKRMNVRDLEPSPWGLPGTA